MYMHSDTHTGAHTFMYTDKLTSSPTVNFVARQRDTHFMNEGVKMKRREEKKNY